MKLNLKAAVARAAAVKTLALSGLVETGFYVAGGCLVRGAWLWTPAAGWTVAGLLVLAWSIIGSKRAT